MQPPATNPMKTPATNTMKTPSNCIIEPYEASATNTMKTPATNTMKTLRIRRILGHILILYNTNRDEYPL